MQVQITVNPFNFIIAGKSIFTLQSNKTGKHFTFKVTAPKSKVKDNSDLFFVSVLTGNDNDSSYTYIGYLRLNKYTNRWEYIHGKNSKITNNATSVLAFNYCVVKYYAQNSIPADAKFFHNGFCCRCGRRLTTPESITMGIGPECVRIKDKYNRG